MPPSWTVSAMSARPVMGRLGLGRMRMPSMIGKLPVNTGVSRDSRGSSRANAGSLMMLANVTSSTTTVSGSNPSLRARILAFARAMSRKMFGVPDAHDDSAALAWVTVEAIAASATESIVLVRARLTGSIF